MPHRTSAQLRLPPLIESFGVEAVVPNALVVRRLLFVRVCRDELYNDASSSTFIQLDVLPAPFIGRQEFRLVDISFQIFEGEHRVLAGIQAPQAKVPELVGSVLLIQIPPIAMLRARNIQNRDMRGRLALAVYGCPSIIAPFAPITTSRAVPGPTMNPESATSRPSRLTDFVM